MPTNLQLAISAGQFPSGYCPTTWQQLANDIVSALKVQMPGNYTLWNYGNTEPSAENRDRPWLRLAADGSPDRIYVWFNGKWVSRYEVPANSAIRAIWTGSIADLQTFDGGSATVTDPATTGPFWEVDTAFEGRIPAGVGALPSGTLVTLGVNIGSDQLTLENANFPEHFHYVAHSQQVNNSPFLDGSHALAYRGGGMGSENYVLLGIDADTNEANVGQTSKSGTKEDDLEPVNILNPVRGVYIVKRTARIWRTPT